MNISFEPERLQVSRPLGETGTTILALTGDLDAGTTQKLAHRIGHVLAMDPTPETLVLDLGELSFLSLAGIRFLYAAHAGTGAECIRLRVVTGCRPAVLGALRATGFHAVLDCYDSTASAVLACGRAEFVDAVQASLGS
ncbi:anti-anti-sigma factor [Amycolatopsis xylanica]|uniref:Anti-anti-sigma factor n=1 Tax=Amycolatopsis xylanica TaxID=589385 RepID=A0A1H3H5N7_9PSEU|nr:STAS domain-containing protein [Amycolatopsis xylanica]SDY10064.1 anti-anti-sigma factor [Amycolatopsis xylanica]